MSKCANKAEAASAAWHALAKHAAKECDRGLLEDGAAYPVELEIDGTVGGKPFAATVAGVLTVGHSRTQASSTGAPTEALVGYLLCHLTTDEATANKVAERLVAGFELAGQIPEYPEKARYEEIAERLLGRLRSRKTVEQKGTVSFRPAA